MLDGWAGEEVAVRIVNETDDLVAVSIGRLSPRQASKAPALFWPLSFEVAHEHDEQPGIWLHPNLLDRAWLHEGGFVVELHQGHVTVNVRRLHR
ncbi:MAG: hypothetical protein JW895_09245 [Thermoleophilaceae bacterium]|nr:hypothetical protein [Thermoleophilaceae bacterium]